ncbi:MAG: pilus assembly protein [Propionibacteriaceae bacterium]|nr:pilus assembly protein [Propionibacteriaceae bacterium]
MRTGRPQCAGAERGLATAVEAAIVLPVLMLLIGLVVVLAGRALAQQSVDGAAFAAARAASLEKNPAAAERAGRAAAEVDLGSSRVRCRGITVTVDSSRFTAASGAEAFVTTTVTCQAVFPISLPGLPENVTIRGQGRAPVDPYRSSDE